MKKFATALALFLAMTTAADAARCFLFFCPPVQHRNRGTADEDGPKQTAPKRFCNGVLEAYDKSPWPRDKEKFIQVFPAAKQKQVRACLPIGN